jgi:limonene 1,2-monooxygenase
VTLDSNGTSTTQSPAGPRFGIFLGPFHNPRQNNALALERDLRLCEHLDELGFDEAWFGEHHSGGYEVSPMPELMIAAAAQRTKRLTLASGVISLPYHHPLMVADRMAFLDHLTRGRVIFGVGPGALPNDSYMMGMDYGRLRARMEESLDAIIELFESDEPVNVKSDWFELREARIHVKGYKRKRVRLAAAQAVSPAGPRLAGKHGIGLVSFGSTSAAGVEAMKQTWEIVEQQAGIHGQTVSRGDWSMVTMMHLAETEEQAIEDVAYGFDDFFAYHHIVNATDMWSAEENLSRAQKCRRIFEAGAGVVGTPEMAVQHVQRILDSSGGIGSILLFATDWANSDAMFRSYELFAREVMPHFDGSITPRVNSYDWYHERRQAGLETVNAGQQRATQEYEARKAAMETRPAP